ncbi:5827_t:CDS:2 [Entrophospora sp. SA101]
MAILQKKVFHLAVNFLKIDEKMQNNLGIRMELFNGRNDEGVLEGDNMEEISSEEEEEEEERNEKSIAVEVLVESIMTK